MNDAFSNPTISALLGAGVGGVIGFASGLVSGLLVNRRQRRDTHRAAVRAVLYELTENLPAVQNPAVAGRPSTRTYDNLVVPLFTDLPDDISQKVSMAYAMLHATGLGFSMLNYGQQKTIRDAVSAAQDSLRTYAQGKLKMTFDPVQAP